MNELDQHLLVLKSVLKRYVVSLILIIASVAFLGMGQNETGNVGRPMWAASGLLGFSAAIAPLFITGKMPFGLMLKHLFFNVAVLVGWWYYDPLAYSNDLLKFGAVIMIIVNILTLYNWDDIYQGDEK